MADSACTISRKVEFLRQAAAYPHGPGEVEVVETHMAWVFLAGEYAFKMKKPVRYEFLDFTTLAAREFTCREELRLNRRLAGDTYMDVVPLRLDARGELTFAGNGAPVEWLVKMKRLPAERMLDTAIGSGSARESDIAEMAKILAAFYRAAPPVEQTTETVWRRFKEEHERNAKLLASPQFNLDRAATGDVLRRMGAALTQARPLLDQRVEARVYLEGHGDLRPEHICLISPPVIIDCLEFNRDLRLLDPFDEIAFLVLECERLGAPCIGRQILSVCLRELSAPPPRLLDFYRAARALLRARLALAHLTEPNPRLPAKWEPRAREYILLADAALARFEADQGRAAGHGLDATM